MTSSQARSYSAAGAMRTAMACSSLAASAGHRLTPYRSSTDATLPKQRVQVDAAPRRECPLRQVTSMVRV